MPKDAMPKDAVPKDAVPKDAVPSDAVPMPAAEPDCLICRINDGSVVLPHGLIYQDDLWVVRLIEPPWAVAGWLVLQTRRHCPEPAMFTDAEATSFGPVLRRFERLLREVTGAERIYTAALGEKVRHFHCHMVPRYEPAPHGAVGWDLFRLQSRVAADEAGADPVDVDRIVRALMARLASG